MAFEFITKAKDFLKEKTSEFFKPTSNVRARDIIREIPKATKDVGVSIFQGSMRGLDTLGRTFLGEPVTKKKTPTGKLETALFGEKPFSLSTEGSDFTRLFGVKEDSRAGKFINPIVGLGFTLIDAIPGGGASKSVAIKSAEDIISLLKTVSDDAVKTISKTSDPNIIKQTLKMESGMGARAFKSTKTNIDDIVSTLAKTTDEDTVKNILKTEQDKYISHLDNRIKEYTKMTEEAFNKRTSDLVKQKQQIEALPLKQRIIQGIRPTESIRVNPYKVLKTRIDAMAKASKTGALFAKKEIYKMQDELVQQIKTDIPLQIRGKFITQIRNANTPKKLSDALLKVDTESLIIAKELEASKRIGKTRQKIAFINKINEFNQLAIRDIKNTIGIDKPIKKMNEEEITKFFNELVKRMQTKIGRASEFAKRKDKITMDEYSIAHQYFENPTLKEKISGVKDDILKTADKYVGILSERLREISPEILSRTRKMEMDIKINEMKDIKGIESLVKGMINFRKSNFQEYKALDLMLKNGDIDEALKLVGSNSPIGKSIIESRSVLDGIHSRLKEVNSKIGYQEGYFPRQINPNKIDEFMDFISTTPIAGPINRAIAEREMKLGRSLNIDEKTAVINSMIRGFNPSSITLASPKNLEERVFQFLPPEVNQFYDDVVETLPKYIRSMNEYIEARKLFGKVDKNLIGDDYNITDSVGAYVAKLQDENKITTNEARELQSILTARFNQGQMSKFVGDLKNAGYILTMGQPTNAITQIGDLGISAYNNGLFGTVKALLGKKKITAQDLGIDQMAKEFSDVSGKKFNLGKLTQQIFKATGLTKFDFLGKNTLINGAFEGARQKILRGDAKIKQEFVNIFDKRADEVMNKVSKGIIDEDSKFYLFNILSDFQPITDLEVPEKYLTSSNGKLFYQLMTWSIKALNTYRREVISEIKQGNTISGLQNFVKLTAFLTLAGATANEVKDFIRGKEVPFKENVINSMIQISGIFNRYGLEKGAREGAIFGEAFPVPPQVSLIDNTIQDLSKVLTSFTDADKSFEINDLRSTRNIPFGGDLYYWWFGKGAEKKEETKSTTGLKRVDTLKKSNGSLKRTDKGLKRTQ